MENKKILFLEKKEILNNPRPSTITEFFNKKTLEINSNVVDLGNKKVGYFHVPKCGSRTMLAWTVLLTRPYLLTTNPEWFEESRQYVEYLEIRRLIKSVDYTNFLLRICIVRDPVDRFISAFTNRVLFHEQITGLNYQTNLDDFLNTFDENINTPEYSKFKHHVEPIVYFLGYDPSFYTHIFNIRDMSKVKDLIEQIYGIKLPNLHLQKSGNIEKPKPSARQIEWIKNRYKRDYEVYGKWF